MIARKPLTAPKPRWLPKAKRMTIAAGMLCNGGVVFGADTEEQLGDAVRRVHKIPMLHAPYPQTMITGACQNGHLMDTAIERIFDKLKAEDGTATAESIGEMLQRVMLKLYRNEFKVYPDPSSLYLKLLVAVKPRDENKVGTWSINASVVRRMTEPHEIVGVGELVQYVADHLNYGTESLQNVQFEMAQLLQIAKARVRDVGGESYVHYLCDDGSMGAATWRFSLQRESVYEYFFEHGRSLLIATGMEGTTDEQFDELGQKFIADLKWKHAQILDEEC
jgi:hypothetical protein